MPFFQASTSTQQNIWHEWVYRSYNLVTTAKNLVVAGVAGFRIELVGLHVYHYSGTTPHSLGFYQGTVQQICYLRTNAGISGLTNFGHAPIVLADGQDLNVAIASGTWVGEVTAIYRYVPS